MNDAAQDTAAPDNDRQNVTPYVMRDNPLHISHVIGDLYKLIGDGDISRFLTRVEEESK